MNKNSFKEKDICIFCQAAADLAYTLDIVSKNPTSTFHIYVINVESIYTFLVELNIPSIEVTFLPYLTFNIKSFISINRVRKEIKKICEKEFNQITNSVIYFFSTSYDWNTASFVSYLSRKINNKIIYYNHYDHLTVLQGEKRFVLKNFLQSFIYKYITKASFDYKTTINFPLFNYKKFGITLYQQSRKPQIEKRFLFKSGLKTNSNLLFFLSPDEYNRLSEKGKVSLNKLLQNLKEIGHVLVIKGHPRLGVPEEILNKFNHTLPAYIPSEFIDYTEYKKVIGISSASLCYPASELNIDVISLIDYLDFNDNIKIKGYKSYITQYSNNTILFADSNLEFK